MTCTISSSTKALVASGNLWMRSLRPSVLFDQLAEMYGGTAKVMSPTFGGTATPVVYADLFRMLGVRVTLLTFRTLTELEAAVRSARGPIVFGLRWAGGGGHTKGRLPVGHSHAWLHRATFADVLRQSSRFGGLTGHPMRRAG